MLSKIFFDTKSPFYNIHKKKEEKGKVLNIGCLNGLNASFLYAKSISHEDTYKILKMLEGETKAFESIAKFYNVDLDKFKKDLLIILKGRLENEPKYI